MTDEWIIQLEKYLKKISKQKFLKEWNKTKEFDNVESPFYIRTDSLKMVSRIEEFFEDIQYVFPEANFKLGFCDYNNRFVVIVTPKKLYYNKEYIRCEYLFQRWFDEYFDGYSIMFAEPDEESGLSITRQLGTF